MKYQIMMLTIDQIEIHLDMLLYCMSISLCANTYSFFIYLLECIINIFNLYNYVILKRETYMTMKFSFLGGFRAVNFHNIFIIHT